MGHLASQSPLGSSSVKLEGEYLLRVMVVGRIQWVTKSSVTIQAVTTRATMTILCMPVS